MEAEHRTWVTKLIAALSGDGDLESVELDPDRCRFGRWYRADGKKRYGELQSFSALDALHRQVHAIGAEMADAHRKGDEEALRRAGDLFAARDRMIARLCLLQSEVAADRCRLDA
jgi:hypothetical protein